MSIDFNKIQSMLGFGLSVFAAVSGAMMWYRGSIQKSYAAERDFRHLRNNQESHAKALAMVDGEVKELRDEIAERFHRQETELVQIKSLLMAQFARNGDSISGIFGRKE
ncbi:hypothetical protein H6F67_10150 [Microcoleus sp. FACHB-1515]|uniref:hypothetical protein n=1 Tax=Cyanophyceae TaxID=3028117 RepID=UPI001689F281|nr:hypothetical protein [Microcoleus sp. FACHB-1515]MBD2090213.1 hypothetical protein [Microcoleus sp. FACHB-1515]